MTSASELLRACYCQSAFCIYTTLLWPTPYHITHSPPTRAPDSTAAGLVYHAPFPGPYAAIMGSATLVSHIGKPPVRASVFIIVEAAKSQWTGLTALYLYML